MHITRILLFLFFAVAAVPAGAAELQLKSEVPFREDAGLSISEYYIAEGKYAQAVDAASGVLKRHPKSADAYAYRGYALMQLGDNVKAKENLQRAIAANATHLGANVYLGEIYLAEDNVAQALEQMQVVRMICGETGCAELDALQSSINRYRKEKKKQGG